MPYISQVKFNNKNYSTQTVDLGLRTLIVGPNESHKSTIVEALLYGIYGSMPDIVNRRGAVSSPGIIKYTVPGMAKPYVELIDSNGSVFNTAIYGKGVPPYTYTAEAFSGSANSANEFVTAQFMTPKSLLPLLVKVAAKNGSVAPFDTSNIATNGDVLNLCTGVEQALRHVERLQAEAQNEYDTGRKEITQLMATPELLPIEFEIAGLRVAAIKEWLSMVPPSLRPSALGHVKSLCAMTEIDISTIKNARTIYEASKTAATALEVRRLQDQEKLIMDRMKDLNGRQVKQEAWTIQLSVIKNMMYEYSGQHMCDIINGILGQGDGIAYDHTKGYLGVLRADPNGQEDKHWSMSGSVTARVIGVIAAATVPDNTYHVVTLPDRSWDEKHLSRCMENLSAFSCQSVICNTFAPKRIPNGWTVLKVG